MTDSNPLFRGVQQLADLSGLTQGPARLVIDEWRRFLGENAHLTRGVCRTVRGAMRVAAEETLKARDAHVSQLEERLARLEAELAQARRSPAAE